MALLLSSTVSSWANSLKSKELQKEYKKVCKQLKNDGWKVYGKPQTLDAALEEHFLALEEGSDSLMVITGFGSAKSTDIASRKATTHAAKQYASMKGSDINREITTKIETTQAGDEVATNTSFESAGRTTTQQNVKAFVPHLTLHRTLEDGTVEMQAFFLVKQF